MISYPPSKIPTSRTFWKQLHLCLRWPLSLCRLRCHPPSGIRNHLPSRQPGGHHTESGMTAASPIDFSRASRSPDKSLPVDSSSRPAPDVRHARLPECRPPRGWSSYRPSHLPGALPLPVPGCLWAPLIPVNPAQGGGVIHLVSHRWKSAAFDPLLEWKLFPPRSTLLFSSGACWDLTQLRD